MTDQFSAEVLLDRLVELRDTVSDIDAEMQAETNAINSEKQALIDSIYTEEIREKVREIEEEYAPKIEGITSKFTEKAMELNKNISDTEAMIKADVIARGETAHNDILEAVFVNGRTTWDSKGLNEAIKVLPQLEQYKKQGDPYVTIRARSTKK